MSERDSGGPLVALPVPQQHVDPAIIEMVSHASDLGTALRAFKLAIERETTGDADLYVDAGVIAFGRTMTHSSVRRLLDVYVDLSAHERAASWLKQYRHKSVAHSVSDMTQSRLMAYSKGGSELDLISYVTITSHVPRRFLQESIEMLEDLLDQLDARIEHACSELASRLTWAEVVDAQTGEASVHEVDSVDAWTFGAARQRTGGPLRVNSEWVAESSD